MDIDLRVASNNTCSSHRFYKNDEPLRRRPLQEICGNSKQAFFSPFKVEVDLETGQRQSWIENKSRKELIDLTGKARKKEKFKEHYKTEDSSKGTVGRCMKPSIPFKNGANELTVESNNHLRSEEVKLALDTSKEDFLKLTIKKALTEILSEVTSEGIDEICHDVVTSNGTKEEEELKIWPDTKKKLFCKQVTNINVPSDEHEYHLNQVKIDKVIQSLMEEVNLKRKTRENQLKRRLQKKVKVVEITKACGSKRPRSPSHKEEFLLSKKIKLSPMREVKKVPALERFVSPHRKQTRQSSKFESQWSEMLSQERRRLGMENQYKPVKEKDPNSWYSKTDKNENCQWSQNHEQLRLTVGTLGWSQTQINYINKLKKRPKVGTLGWSSTQIKYINRLL